MLCTSSLLVKAQYGSKTGQIAAIGNMQLESGKQIDDCRIGYQTYGKLNAHKSNAILFPTWFLGTAQQLATTVRPWQFIDTSRYCLIIADALGNGISSSPSNSTTQHGPLFPTVTITDIVNAHHQLLLKAMGIAHLKAVIGTSMGAFQAYQWAVSYPGFMDNIIAVFGSPQLHSYDIIRQSTIIAAIDESPAYNHGNYTVNPSIPLAQSLFTLSTTTSSYIDETINRADATDYIKASGNTNFDWNDFRLQLSACVGQDISRTCNGSLAIAAKRISAKMLIVNNLQDQVVSPYPAVRFAKMVHAKLLLVNNNLGHQGMNYADKRFKQCVNALLATK